MRVISGLLSTCSMVPLSSATSCPDGSEYRALPARLPGCPSFIRPQRLHHGGAQPDPSSVRVLRLLQGARRTACQEATRLGMSSAPFLGPSGHCKVERMGERLLKSRGLPG